MSDQYQRQDEQGGAGGPNAVSVPSALIGIVRRVQAFIKTGSHLSGRSKSIFLLVIVALLLGGIVLAFSVQPDILQRVKWTPALVLLLVGIPVTILINSLEFQATARLLDRRITFRAALEVTTVGSVANLLPVPGGAITRIAGLKLAGSTLREGTMVIFLMSLAWIGVAFMVGSLPLILMGDRLAGWLLLAVGTALTGISIVASLKISASRKRTFVAFALKVVLVVWDGMRMYLALLAVDAGIGLAGAYIFVLASVAGSTVTIIPAGFGIREGTSALLALVVGVPAALGFLAASLLRLTELIVLLPVGLWLAYRRNAEKITMDTKKATESNSP